MSGKINVTAPEFNRLYELFLAVGELDDELFNHGPRSPRLGEKWRALRRAYEAAWAYYDAGGGRGRPKGGEKKPDNECAQGAVR